MQAVTEILGTTFPIIQAPMSWITDAKLVAAVSNAGGLGVLGPNAGQTTVTSGPTETAERMRKEIQKTQTLTDKPFGINILLGGENIDENNPFLNGLLNVSFEEKVKYFVTVGEVNKKVFAQIKNHGGTIIHRPLTPTIAKMKYAEAVGADILVATGYDEGGVIPDKAFGTFTVVPTMVDAVNIPVLAAGGINDSRGVKAAFALGAKGVYVGTRFIVTEESPAAEATKLKIIASTYDDILSVSYNQRSIKNTASKKLGELFLDPTNKKDLNKEIGKLGGVRPGMLAGELDRGIISVNTGIDTIDRIDSVETLINNLMQKWNESEQ